MAVSCVTRVSLGGRKHIVAISDATLPCKKWLICCDVLLLFNPPPPPISTPWRCATGPLVDQQSQMLVSSVEGDPELGRRVSALCCAL